MCTYELPHSPTAQYLQDNTARLIREVGTVQDTANNVIPEIIHETRVYYCTIKKEAVTCIMAV